MTIILQPEHDRLIAEALRSGAYQSSEEVIKQALELLHQRDAWLVENRAKIEEGYAAAQRGELIDSDPALELSGGSLEVVPRREAYPVEQTLLILEAC